MNETAGRFRGRLARAVAIGAITALTVMGLAVAQESQFADDPDGWMADCGIPGSEFFTVEDMGWVEVGLRTRGLVLIDFDAFDGAEVEVTEDTAALIELGFTSDDETAVLAITHTDGEIQFDESSATGDVSTTGEASSADSATGEEDGVDSDSPDADSSDNVLGPTEDADDKTGADDSSDNTSPAPQGGDEAESNKSAGLWLWIRTGLHSPLADAGLKAGLGVTANHG